MVFQQSAWERLDLAEGDGFPSKGLPGHAGGFNS